ncbi:MAG TPA: Spy/CpxP family protein refolding chaperone [Geobacteraceae bacterium]|nr:Spy/CpxP family protein refolding chaperone [Geobacteraceae bacterium]
MKRLVVMALISTSALYGGVSSAQAAPPPDPWEIIIREAVREDGNKPENAPPEPHPAPRYGGPPMGIDCESHFGGEMHGPPARPSGEVRFNDGIPAPPVMALHEGCLPCLAKALGLTDAQKKQIAAIAREDRDKAAPVLKKRDEIVNRLRQAERAATFDEKAVRSMAGSLAQLETDLIVLRAKAHNRIGSVLTSVQRVIMENLAPEAECPPGPHPGAMERK